VNPAVEGYMAAVVDATPIPARRDLAAEVAAVDRLLQHNADLRAAMTDVTVPARARRAALTELLAGKISPAAARLCGFAAGAVHAQEVPLAIAWVANRLRRVAETAASQTAVPAASQTAAPAASQTAAPAASQTAAPAASQTAAPLEVTEEPLGHREARERVGGYAAAVLEDLSVAELETVEDELFRFARIVGSTPELRTALSDRDLPASVRCGVVDELLSGKVHQATLRLADYAIVGGRARDVPGTLDWLVEQVASARGWRVARVRAGQEVDDEERFELADRLSRLAGAPVELQVTVDPTLLAGVTVEIGDLQLDATARGRLDRLREHMTTGSWTDLGFDSAALGSAALGSAALGSAALDSAALGSAALGADGQTLDTKHTSNEGSRGS
jgi:F-type H+-transporting ATPase subunit delta